jgi:hypothetical protein
MEANLKAKVLIYQFSNCDNDEMYIGTAKKCAIICVDEILNASMSHFDDSYVIYWEEVKSELLKL